MGICGMLPDLLGFCMRNRYHNIFVKSEKQFNLYPISYRSGHIWATYYVSDKLFLWLVIFIVINKRLALWMHLEVGW